MSQIEELQSRITAAIDRISAGVEVLAVPQMIETPGLSGNSAETPDGLQAALDEERMVNAQLEERLKTLKSRHRAELDEARQNGALDDGSDTDTAALTAEIDSLKSQLAEAGDTDTLKSELADATAQLMAAETAKTELNDALATREQNDETPVLKAEIDALKAQIDAAEDAEPLKAEIEALKNELAAREVPGELKSELEMLRAERESLGGAMSRLDDDLQRLRKANDELRDVNAALRDANQQGIGDPTLINKAMLAELEALRASRATVAAEAHAVLARLEPVLAQATLTEGEEV
ncbi:MAG: hypothetical protein AAF408_05550 [Pseudomonadota bacterium]